MESEDIAKDSYVSLQVLLGALAVASCMRSHGLNVNPICQLCHMEEKSVSHALFRCTQLLRFGVQLAYLDRLMDSRHPQRRM